jgi:hypothetical protein
MADFNEYDGLLEQESQSNADQLKGSMYAVESVNPDQRAESTRLAEINKVPVGFVESNIDSFKQAPKTFESEYDKLINNNPKLTEYLADMDNAALSKDDVEPLTKTEDIVKSRDSDYSFTDVLAYGFAGFNKQISQIPNLIYDAAAYPQNKIASMAGYPEYQVRSTQLGENPVAGFFEQSQKQIGAKIPELDVSIVDEAIGKGNFANAGKALAVQVAANAPQQLALLGLYVSGYGAIGLAGAGALSAAEKNVENQKAGVDAALSVESAAYTGALEAAFEKLGTLSGLERAAKQLAKNYGKTTAKEIMMNTIKSVGIESAEEGLSESATSVSQDLVDYWTGINPDALIGIGERAANAGLVGFASGGVMTSPTAAIVASKQVQDVRKSEINRDFFIAIGENAKESKTYQRLPEQYKKYVDQLTKDGSVENVFIDPNDVDQYFQSKGLSPIEELSKIGLSKEYEMAKETGQDITIKTSDMIMKVLPTEHYNALASDIKFNQNELSYNQAKKQREQFKEFFQKQAQTEVDENGNEIIDDVTQKLIAAGVPEAEAKNSAQVFRFMDYVARETGRSPESVYAQYGLRIEQGIAPDAGELQQTASESGFSQTDYKFPLSVNVVNDLGKVFASGKDIKNTAINSVAGKSIVNQHTGITINTRISGIERSGDMLGSEANKRLLLNLPELLENAVYARFEKDTQKGALPFQGNHIFYAPLKTANKDYVMKMVVREEQGIYFHESLGIEKEHLGRYRQQTTTIPGGISKDTISITELIQDVAKIRKTIPYFQATNLPGAERSDLGFYSKLEQTIIDKVPNNASADQILGTLKDVKPEELEWSGLGDFLKDKKKISKEDLLTFVRANNLQVREVVIGYTGPLKSQIALNLFNDQMREKYNRDFFNKASDEDYAEYEKLVAAESKERGDLINRESNRDPKFSEYVLPGGENYREVLFTLPEQAEQTELPQGFKILDEGENTKFPQSRFKIVGPSVNGEQRYASAESREEVLNKFRQTHSESYTKKQNFKSSHFDQPNILAHTRLTDRTDADGKKVLFVEEIQSDWHQAGRDKGYKTGDETRDFAKERRDLTSEFNSIRMQNDMFTEDGRAIVIGDVTRNIKFAKEVIQAYELSQTEGDIKSLENNLSKADSEKFANLPQEVIDIANKYDQVFKEERSANVAVPNAPLKKTWHEFVLKRIITQAAEQGYDRVSWTTGDQQAARYKNALLDKVDKFFTKKNEDGSYDLIAEYDGSTVTTEKNISKSRVFDLVGKSLGDQLVHAADSTEGVATLEGTDFNIGGEGMRGFYDKILVNYANKLGKKFGVKVVEGNIGKESTNVVVWDNVNNEGVVSFETAEEAKDFINNDKDLEIRSGIYIDGSKRVANEISVHTLDITPELKETAINQGFELYQGSNVYRGSYNPKERLIKLFSQRDKSTFMHESAHFFLDVFGDSAQLDNASDKLKADYAAVLKYLGVEKREDIKVKQHEKFARSFEAYLREGKSPSLALKKAFNSYKKWLTKIYPMAAQLDAQLTPEIRGVFDRMLATEKEIDEAQRITDVKPLLSKEQLVGLNEDEQAAYATAIEEARLYAEGKLYKKLEAKEEVKKSKEYNSRFKELTAEARKRLAENPIYNAIEILSTGKNVDGESVSPVKIDSTSMSRYLEGVDKRYTSIDQGIAVELVAEMFGYSDTRAFIKDLQDNVSIDEAAKAEAEQAVTLEFLDVLTDIKEDATEALHNAKREDLLRFELEYLFKAELPVLKTAIKKIVRRVPPKAQVKAQANEIIGGIQVGQIKPYLYTRAMVKAAREAGVALAKGDLQAAYDAKTREYLNHELFLAATEANDTVDKSVRKFKKLDKTNEDLAKTRDVDLMNAAKAVLSRFGIGRDQASPLDYLENLKKYGPEKYDVIKNLIADAVEGAGPYESVSFNDFMEMKKAVDALTEMAKLEKQSTIDGEKIQFDKIKADLIAQVSKFDGGKNNDKYKQTADKFDKFKANLASSLAALKRVEFWSDTMDLGVATGPFKKYIFDPISQAGAKYRLKKEEVINKYKDINEKYKDIFTQEPIEASEIGFRFRNKGELLMALLHSGNESNKSKLLRGRQWGFLREDGSLDSADFDNMRMRLIQQNVIKKADMDYVQEIWDLMESLKPESQKAHKDMFGYYFNEITAGEITTPFGKYRGGYIPAKVDTFENEDAKIRQERNEFEESGLGMSFMYPTTGKGFTKSRIDAYAAPLSLDLNLLAGHIDASLRFSYIEPRVKEVAKIVYNKEFRSVLATVDKNAGSDVLIPWLQRSASQQTVTPGIGYFKVIDRAAVYLRSAVAMQIMVGNVSNALQQFTGTIVAASKVQPKHLLAGMVGYIKDVKGSQQNMIDKSEYMRSTQGNKLFESMQRIEEISTDPSVFENVQNFAKQHTYFLQTATQNIVNTIVWTGAYNQAVVEGLTEKQAITAADRAIRTTQGSVLAEDMSAFEVGSPTYRLFTQFAGYFNMLANLNSSEIQKIKKTIGLKNGAGKLFYTYLTAFMLPAVLSDIIVKGMRGEYGEGDDEELMMTWLDSFFGSQFRTATATTPIVGQLANTIVGKFTDQPFDDRLSFSPVLSVLEGTAGVPFQIYKGLTKDEVNEKKVAKDVLMLMGVATNLPLAPLGKPLGYMIDVEQGKARPSGPIDFTRGLISGQPGK